MSKGFTLIELLAVIIVVGILAAFALPRFANLSSDARTATVAATRAALRGGVNVVHQKWQAAGSPGARLNFIAISSPTAGGNLSVNQWGWPADTRGTSLTLNSLNDCLDVWRAVLEEGAPTVSNTTTTDYRAVYSAIAGSTSGSCAYTLQSDVTQVITFNSRTGVVN